MALLVLRREKTLKTVYLIDQLSFKFIPFADCCELRKLCGETAPCEGMREIWSDLEVKPSTDSNIRWGVDYVELNHPRVKLLHSLDLD